MKSISKIIKNKSVNIVDRTLTDWDINLREKRGNYYLFITFSSQSEMHF